MEKRASVIRELKKGAVTMRLNNTAASISKLISYGKDAGKEYKELHISDEQMDALIKDKMRGEAGIAINSTFTHSPDAPYYYGVKLLPQSSSMLADYVSARLPAA